MNEETTAPRDLIQKPPALPAVTSDDLVMYAGMNIDPKKLAELFAVNVGPAGITEFSLPRIKVPTSGGSTFELPDVATGGTRSETTFQAVILEARDIRAYWKDPYDETGGVPPDCRSNDCVTGFGDPGGLCGTDENPICPFAAFGSDESSKGKRKGQACKHMKQMFIARRGSGNWLPEVINAPPTVIGVFRTYTLALLGTQQFLDGVVTEFGLTKQKNSTGLPYSRLSFRHVAVLAPEVLDRFRGYTRQMSALWRREPRPAIPAPHPTSAIPPAEREKAF